MKVAIAKDGNEVSAHFGHCSEYAVFDIADNKIIKQTILESPGHDPGKLPAFLATHKVTHVLAGGMGPLPWTYSARTISRCSWGYPDRSTM